MAKKEPVAINTQTSLDAHVSGEGAQNVRPKRSFGGWLRGGFAALVCVTVVATMSTLMFRERQFKRGVVTIGESLTVLVDVADTDATRERGLSGRKMLGERHGMVFLFSEPDRYSFWMKDMRFPIDILWIKDGEVVDITTDALIPIDGRPIPTYFPASPANMVLEVPAGFAEKHGLRVGIPVQFRLDKS
jgi:hypothetical protein